MLDLLRLCRLYYAGPLALTFTLTVAYACGGSAANDWHTWLATAALFLVIAAAYAFNDACDRFVDRVNAPYRPVTAGRVRPNAAVLLAAVLCAVGLGLGTLCRWEFLVTLALVSAGLACYDLYSKQLVWGKPLLVALLMTSIYPLALAQAGELSGRRATTLIFFPVWMFLTSFGYEVLKDLRDAEGDRNCGDPAVDCAGRSRPGRRAARAAVLAGAAVLLVPAMVGCGWVYLAIVPLAMAAGAVSCLANVRRAIAFVYVEFVLVGLAATADLLVSGS